MEELLDALAGATGQTETTPPDDPSYVVNARAIGWADPGIVGLELNDYGFAFTADDATQIGAAVLAEGLLNGGEPDDDTLSGFDDYSLEVSDDAVTVRYTGDGGDDDPAAAEGEDEPTGDGTAIDIE